MQTYTLRRQWFAIGRSYWVEDTAGARVFRVAGRVGFARRFSIRDLRNNVLYSAREKLLVLDPTFVVSRDGAEAAVVRRTTTSGVVNEKFEIVLQSGEMLRASGCLFQDEGVRIFRESTCLADIRRQQEAIREIFHASVSRSADQALLLAVAMSIVEIDPSRGNPAT